MYSQFNLTSLVRMMRAVSDPSEELMLKDEMKYLLHMKKYEYGYERNNDSMVNVINNLLNTPKAYSFNEKMMVGLIETGYMQDEFRLMNSNDYPNFLIFMLTKSERFKIKEACCRKMIRLFADKKKTPGDKMTTPGQDMNAGDEGSKLEFINLVEPLIQTMKTSNYNLTSLSVSALINLCQYSEDIKDIFIKKHGDSAILEYLTCKEEDTLFNVLRLMMTLIGKSDSIGKMMAEKTNLEAVNSLLKIVQGPNIHQT
mmetsp:Transcript_8002/g.7496  ORF Transcript_8002/g.7496 Transcript_8002/m.7496 type:complete len:256 (+) Transcript_8002:1322-2089(+)